MPKPSEYRHIKAWGRLLDSNPSYIQTEQERAAVADAPIDALYEYTGGWAVATDLSKDHDVFELL